MTKTEQLERLTDVVRGLESLGASVLSANTGMVDVPDVQLSQYDLPEEVLRREQGKSRWQHYIEHFYITPSGIRVFWMTNLNEGESHDS